MLTNIVFVFPVIHLYSSFTLLYDSLALFMYDYGLEANKQVRLQRDNPKKDATIFSEIFANSVERK